MRRGKRTVSCAKFNRSAVNIRKFVLVIGSWSKVPAKIKFGNTFDFGNFDQCVKIYQKSSDQQVIKGQHCLYQFYSKLNDTISKSSELSPLNTGWKHLDKRFGGAICLPQACAPKTVTKFLKILFETSDFGIADDYEQADYCKISQTNRVLSKSSTVTLFFSILLVICVISSSVYDFLNSKHDRKSRTELFLTFSLLKNLPNLLNLSRDPNEEVRSLYCIRAFSSIGILLFHIYVFSLVFPSNLDKNSEFSLHLRTIGVIGCFVNSFFVMSGFLATKSVIKDLKK